MIVCLQSDTVPISATDSTPAPLLDMNWGLDLPRSLDYMEDSMLTTEQIKIIGQVCVLLFQKTETCPQLHFTGEAQSAALSWLCPQVIGRANCPWHPPHCSYSQQRVPFPHLLKVCCPGCLTEQGSYRLGDFKHGSHISILVRHT